MRVGRRASAIMRVAVMPVTLEAPTRRYRWPGGITYDAARNQANGAADEGACKRTHRSISKPLLCMYGDRRKGYSGDCDHDRK